MPPKSPATAIARLLATLSLATLSLALPACAPAQTPRQSIPRTVEDALHQMSDSAGIIFTGEVLAIRSIPGQDGASGIVEIDFRVDHAIRGASAGSAYTLREWAGLWAGGEPRYRTGQNLLMLLHSPGPSGITSPVAGMAGAIPIRATSSAPQANSASTATSPLIADLRWVGTRIQRSTLPASPTLATAALATAATSAPAQPEISDASVASQQAPISVVIGMLSSWQPPQATQP